MHILFTEYLINIQNDIQKLYVAYIKKILHIVLLVLYMVIE